MRKVTQRMLDGEAREEDADLLKSIADQIAGRTICAFGEAGSCRVESFIAKFKEELVEKAQEQAARRKEGKETAETTTLI